MIQATCLLRLEALVMSAPLSQRGIPCKPPLTPGIYMIHDAASTPGSRAVFVSSLESDVRDVAVLQARAIAMCRLVHWCHGAPGMAMMLAMMSSVFGSAHPHDFDQFLQRCDFPGAQLLLPVTPLLTAGMHSALPAGA